MTEAERVAEIKRRQDLLFDAFRHEGILGGRYLGPTMDREKEIGDVFVQKYYGHRILADSFLDFFGATLVEQIELNNKVGWPNRDAYYATCLIMFLTMFRAARASEVLSVNSYTLQGYVLQRTIKDQVFILCAAASGLASFGRLFGWEGLPEGNWSEEQQKQVVKNRRKIETEIKDQIIGKKSGLKDGTIKLLEKLDWMFNVEAHRGLYSLFRESHNVIVDKHVDISLAPLPDELKDAMYVNRSTETNWMMHRMLPYMRRHDTPANKEWANQWKLLEDHFRWMVESLGAIGKEIAPAFIEMIDTKFKFDATTYYSEPKVVQPE